MSREDRVRFILFINIQAQTQDGSVHAARTSDGRQQCGGGLEDLPEFAAEGRDGLPCRSMLSHVTSSEERGHLPLLLIISDWLFVIALRLNLPPAA